MKTTFSSWCRGIMLLAALLCLAGCARSKPGLPVNMVGREVPPELLPRVERMEKEGERNWVLHLNELAVAAMKRGDRELAKACLDESILHINAVFGTTPEARRARSLFFSESSKLYKGDPYERCMTFLYRGVLYMQDGDFENARACFRAGALQDAFAEEEQARSDWTVFDYLIGVCEVRLGRAGHAEQAYALAETSFFALPKAYNDAFKSQLAAEQKWQLPLLGPEENLLIITQSGIGPQKVNTGSFNQYLSYRPGTNGPQPLVVIGETEAVRPTVIDSVYYQASTRGGRPFDKISGRKVFFKQTSGTAGTVGIYGGAVILSEAKSSEEVTVGLVILAAGLAATAFSELIQTKADTRQWTSLPDTLGLFFAKHAAGQQRVAVQGNGNQWVETMVDVPESGSGLAVVLVFPTPNPSLLSP